MRPALAWEARSGRLLWLHAVTAMPDSCRPGQQWTALMLQRPSCPSLSCIRPMTLPTNFRVTTECQHLRLRVRGACVCIRVCFTCPNVSVCLHAWLLFFTYPGTQQRASGFGWHDGMKPCSVLRRTLPSPGQPQPRPVSTGHVSSVNIYPACPVQAGA